MDDRLAAHRTGESVPLKNKHEGPPSIMFHTTLPTSSATNNCDVSGVEGFMVYGNRI